MLTRVRKSVFARNVAVLMTGTALAQALTIVAAPLLTRLYAPEAFGILGLFTATTAIISVVAAWKYELAIVLPQENEDAIQVLLLSCSIVLLMTVSSVVFVWLGGEMLALALGSAELANYLWWLPLSVLMTGLYNVFNYWSTRRKHFRRLSISQGFHSVGTVGVQIPTGLAGLGAGGLVSGAVAGASVATLVLGAQIWRDDGADIKRASERIRLIRIARKYSDFPTYNAPQSLISALSQNVPAFLLALFFNPAVIGFYWFTHRLLTAPSLLIGKAVRQVYYQRATEIFNQGGSVYTLFKSTTLGLAAAGIVPVILTVLYGPSIFAFVFGAEWYEAGVYAQWLVIAWYCGFMNIPSIMSVPVYSLQGNLLLYDIVLFVARASTIPIGSFIGNDVTAIALFASVSAIFNLGLILSVMMYVRGHGDL